MNKTFNRRPQFVNGPSGNDVKDYYFNHFNWKGMSTDKNFLAADQETFEECNNVYCDEEGLLRSRPSIKPDTSLDNCIDFWIFDKKVFRRTNAGTSYDTLRLPNDDYLDVLKNNSLNLIRKNDKVFIFKGDDVEGLYYYDLSQNKLIFDTAALYVPTTEIISTASTKSEYKNLLTNEYKKQFVYDKDLNLPMGLTEGLSVSHGGIDYHWNANVTPYQIGEAIDNLGHLGIASDLIIHAAVIGLQDVLIVHNTYDKKTYVKFNDSWSLIGTIPSDGVCTSSGVSKNGDLFYAVYECTHLENNKIPNSELWVIDTLDSYGKYRVFTNINVGNYVVDGPIVCSFLDNGAYVIGERDTGMINIFNGGFKASYEYAVDDNGTILSEGAELLAIDCEYDNSALHELSVSVLLNAIYDVDMPIVTVFSKFLVNGNGSNVPYLFTSWKDLTTDTYSYSINNYQRLLSIGTQIYDFDFNKMFNVSSELFVFGNNRPVTISSNGSLVMNDGTYYQSYRLNFISFNITSLASGRYDYFIARDGILYSNSSPKTIILTRKEGDGFTDLVSKVASSVVGELNTFYVASGIDLFISEDRYDENGNFQWYFPEYTKQTFSKPITKLFPISATEMAIFFEDEIWYSSYSDGVYSYYKSKLPVGLNAGSDVITSYDGSKVIFATERGLAALSYQDFVASSEQTLTFLSDPIHSLFSEFVKNPVKICRLQYWYLCYSNDENAYLLDVRNGSWWPLSASEIFSRIFVFDNHVYLFKSPSFFKLDKGDDSYFDQISERCEIRWNIKSQKLHLNAINFSKHIANITLYSVLDSDQRVSFKMDVNNYRKKLDRAEIQTVEYKVDAIRTFVKRVSYFKVNEFQYNLHQDDEETVRLPLSLTGITVKYRISEEVR